MLKIGMDKTDRSFRKFEYDDERMYGDPKKFKVLYEETGVYGEVLCSNVISIKKSTNTHNHFLDIPVYNENKTIESKADPKDVNDLAKLLEEPVEKKKPKSSTKSKANTKTKDKGVPLTGRPIEVKEPTIELDVAQIYPKSFEYDVVVVDNISYTEDVKSKLNEFGKDGWEVCGFQIVQKIFGGGCQAVIIMKKGLI
jgi:hypothetical protein